MKASKVEQKSDELTKRFALLINQALKKGLDEKLVGETFFEAKHKTDINDKSHSWILRSSAVIGILIGLLAILVGVMSPLLGINRHTIIKYVQGTRCVVDNDGLIMEIARPVTSCRLCSDLQEVAVEKNIKTKDFVKKYAYTGIPVLIKESTKSWTAMSEFSFNFFKKLYTEHKGALQTIEDECQFFPYKTEFTNLAQVFNMSDERATFQAGEPWYVGWSNCHQDIATKLRKHYQRPYFLPRESESSIIDWIFMGGFGLGAFIHLDYVQRPSWQAQISGTKTWTLIPPPECEDVCLSMNVTVQKGDIIVLDTNQWYHATFIHPGEISITIGSEYD